MKRIKIYLATLILSMFCCTEVWGGNTISYISSDNDVISPDDPNAFGDAQILSNTYADGKGTIVFDKDVKEIGDYAFYEKLSLVNILIPEGVSEIGEGAFSYCRNLTSIVTPDSLTEIKSSTFCGCTSLTNIHIPEKVTSIGSDAFKECSSLESITIPEGVTEIGNSAFHDCTSLTYISLPMSLKKIDNSAFYSQTPHIDVSVNWETPPVLKYGTFRDDADNPSVTIHVPIGTKANYIFSETWSRYNIVEKRNTIIYTTTDANPVTFGMASFGFSELIGNTYADGKGTILFNCDLESIDNFSFCDFSTLSTIILPESLKYIRTYAFIGCSSLTSINLPESVTTIESNAFTGCNSLTDITAGWETPLTIPDDVFDGIGNLSSVTLHVPYGTGDLYRAADVWKEFNIVEMKPRNIIFYTTTDGNPLTIDDYAFGNMTIIEHTYNNGKGTIQFENDVETINYNSFEDCTTLATIDLPQDLYIIAGEAFKNCTSLTSVDLPSSVKYIGTSAFYNCESLTSINLPKDMTSIDNYAFYNCKSLTSIDLPNKITAINQESFNNCYSLTSIDIPEGVEKIGKRAFYGDYLISTITIPSSVKEISNQAFYYNDMLTDVTVNWLTPLKVPDDLFEGIDDISSVTLSVPFGTSDLYRAANVWKEFNIIETISDADKSAAIGSLAAIVGDINDEDITHMLNKYISQIQSATSATEMISAQTEGEEVLTAMVKLYHRLNVDLPSEGTTGHGVRVILEKEGETDKVLELMNPSRVEFFKR